MGKKDGKKGKLGKDVESAEPNLPTIPEEENVEKLEVPEETVEGQLETDRSSPKTSLKDDTAEAPPEEKRENQSESHAEIRSKSLNEVERTKSLIKDGESAVLVAEGEKVETAESKIDTLELKPVKEKEEKKGKKGKKEPAEGEEGETKAKKGKKGDEEKEKKGKKGKKGKKVQLVTEGEVIQEVEVEEKEVQAEKPEEGDEQPAKKGKKGKKEKAEGTEVKEKKGKKGKDKKEKVEKDTKETQKDLKDEDEENELSAKKSELKALSSRVSFSSKTIIDEKKKSKALLEEGEKKKRKKSKGSKASIGSAEEESSLTRLRKSESLMRKDKSSSTLKVTESTYSYEAQARKLKSASRASRVSMISDFSSSGSSESVREREDHGKKKKGKKDKKHKGEKLEKKESEQIDNELADELREQKKAEQIALKKAKKAEKKAAKKAAKRAKKEAAAAEKKAKGKGDKPGEMDYDEVKKKLEDLKKIAKEMEIIDAVKGDEEEKGPKKKMSKKEKAKLTAEMAEKAKAEMEAEVKRMEELIKKKKEEERLAAIERDKRDVLEQGWRMEQLSASDALIQEIIENNAEITREEKEKLEWEKYVECGKLPNPTICAQMNTYLHLWDLVMDQTSIEVASDVTKDVIKLLGELDELIDTVTEEDQHKLNNWKWIRQLFREYQASSLDVATYRLLRDVEHNLNRINIPTADFNFQNEHLTLCIWLRVMLPIPLPNPRRPPKPRIEISFDLMEVSVLFPITITGDDAAIRAMYLKYDHLSDLSDTFEMPQVPEDYYMDLLAITKKEWRTQLKYKYDHRDKIIKPPSPVPEAPVEQDGGSSPEHLEIPEQKHDGQETVEPEKKIEPEEPEDFASDEEIPTVPFKQLKPTSNEQATMVEDTLYQETRTKLLIDVPEFIINLRKFVILGGVYHLHLLAQPPQPQDFITMEMTITGLYLPKKLEVLPFKVVYTPYVPPEPELTTEQSTMSVSRKLPEEIEDEMKKQEEELDKLISIDIKWPQHVIFLELPIVCRWDDEKKQWSKEEIHDLKHNEEKCILSFRTGVFGIYGLATYKYANLPFQAYDIKPEIDESVTVQLTAAILMLEFNIKDGLIAITQLQNSPNMTLQDIVGKYFKLHRLTRMMKEAGLDIFPAFDAFCYIDGRLL